MAILLTNESMIKHLSTLLLPNEILQVPFSCNVYKPKNIFPLASYIGLTETSLLLIILNQLDVNKIIHSERIPLNIKNIFVKTSSFLNSYDINIKFYNSEDLHIMTVLKTLRGSFVNQEKYVKSFIKRLEFLASIQNT